MTILGSLNFYMNFWVSVHLCKEVSWGFDRDCIDSVDEFVEYCHFYKIRYFDP